MARPTRPYCPRLSGVESHSAPRARAPRRPSPETGRQRRGRRASAVRRAPKIRPRPAAHARPAPPPPSRASRHFTAHASQSPFFTEAMQAALEWATVRKARSHGPRRARTLCRPKARAKGPLGATPPPPTRPTPRASALGGNRDLRAVEVPAGSEDLLRGRGRECQPVFDCFSCPYLFSVRRRSPARAGPRAGASARHGSAGAGQGSARTAQVCVCKGRGRRGTRGGTGSCGRQERPGRAGGLLRCAATPDGVDLKVAIGGVAHDLVVEEACNQEAPCDIVVWRVRVGALRRSAPKGKACVCQGKSSGRRRRGRWVSDQGSLEGLQGSRAGLHRR